MYEKQGLGNWYEIRTHIYIFNYLKNITQTTGKAASHIYLQYHGDSHVADKLVVGLRPSNWHYATLHPAITHQNNSFQPKNKLVTIKCIIKQTASSIDLFANPDS